MNNFDKIKTKYEKQDNLEQLKKWFEWYDQQVIQAGRAERLNLEWSAERDGVSYDTLAQLDAEAVVNANRINAIRTESLA